jgi:hypothetical protein
MIERTRHPDVDKVCHDQRPTLTAIFQALGSVAQCSRHSMI